MYHLIWVFKSMGLFKEYQALEEMPCDPIYTDCMAFPLMLCRFRI